MIKVNHISKSFNGKQALNDLTFNIAKGQIFGFLGPSGSGKTTTINILTGQLKPDGGQATLLGHDVQALTAQDLAKIGLVTDMSGYYEKMSLYDNLLFFAKFYQVNQSHLDDLLKQVDLYDSRKVIAEKLSTGMRQRMLLVRALINSPKVLFLDEPTSGLDPTTSRKIHQLLLQLKEAGTTIFLTTHDMLEATLLCDNLALLNQGKIVEQGNPHQLIQKYHTDKKVQVTFADDSTEIIAFDHLSTVDTHNVIAIHSCEPTLEDIFIQLTGGALND